jgi:hypothetical protein
MKFNLLFLSATLVAFLGIAPSVSSAAAARGDTSLIPPLGAPLGAPFFLLSDRAKPQIEEKPVVRVPTSDHDMMVLKVVLTPGVSSTVVSLNMAQRGRLSYYGDNQWGSTLRTAKILDFIGKEKQPQQLLATFQDLLTTNLAKSKKDAAESKAAESKAAENAASESSVAINTFNRWVQRCARDELLPQLRERGLLVEDEIIFSPSRALNPEVSSRELKSNPNNYFQIPSFNLETHASFVARSKNNLRSVFEKNPHLVFLQEFETGDDGSLSIDELSAFSGYNFVDPTTLPDFVANLSNSCAITLFNPQMFTLSDNELDIIIATQLQEILQILFNLENKPNKLNVIPLVVKQTNKTVYAANMHLDYNVANSSPVLYSMLADLLKLPGLLVGGDLNVRAFNHLGEKQQWLAPLHSSPMCSISALTPEAAIFEGEEYQTLARADVTPETHGEFNPTWDGIYAMHESLRLDVRKETIQILIESFWLAFKNAQKQAKGEDDKNWYKIFINNLGKPSTEEP